MVNNKTWNPNTAAHLKRAREAPGLSLSQVSVLSGIDHEQIEAYELLNYDHRVYFPDQHVNMLAAIYAVSTEYLRGGEPQA